MLQRIAHDLAGEAPTRHAGETNASLSDENITYIKQPLRFTVTHWSSADSIRRNTAPHLFASNKSSQIYMGVLTRPKVGLLKRCIEQIALVQQAVEAFRVRLQQQRGVRWKPVGTLGSWMAQEEREGLDHCLVGAVTIGIRGAVALVPELKDREDVP